MVVLSVECTAEGRCGAHFEGIAETRRQLLMDWASDQWSHLDRVLHQIESVNLQDVKDGSPQADKLNTWFKASYARTQDSTEIFILNEQHQVVFSTYQNHIGQRYNPHGNTSFDPGLRYAQAGIHGQKCLYGPYSDPLTLEIGPRSSTFHDEITLMFIAPIVQQGKVAGALCSRIPGDVLGDLIQRESGHIYRTQVIIICLWPNLYCGLSCSQAPLYLEVALRIERLHTGKISKTV